MKMRVIILLIALCFSVNCYAADINNTKTMGETFGYSMKCLEKYVKNDQRLLEPILNLGYQFHEKYTYWLKKNNKNTQQYMNQLSKSWDEGGAKAALTRGRVCYQEMGKAIKYYKALGVDTSIYEKLRQNFK